MRALIRLLAARSGQLLVATAVGSDAGLTASTVYRYLSLLEEVFLVKRIPAWSRNVSTRAVGTPKLAFTDSGIAANLLGADVRSLLRPGGRFGPLLEGFVLMELARQLTWSRQRAELFHYRTKDKVEVNAVLENRRGEVVGIEVKASSTVGPDDFRGLRHLAARTGDDFIAGVVLYTGTQTLPFGPKMRAMPAAALWEIWSAGNRLARVRVEEVQARRVDGEGDAPAGLDRVCGSTDRPTGRAGSMAIRINGDPGQWRSFVVGIFRPPQESRTISSTGSSGVRSGTGSPAMLRSSNSTACRPVSASGMRTVLSGGVRNSANGMSSQLTTATSGRHPAPGLPQRGQHADGHHVAVHEDRGEPGRAFEQQPGRDGAAVRGPVALGHQVLARLEPRVAQRVLVAVQPAAGDPPPERAGDRADRGVPESEQVGGGQPPGLPVVRPHQRDAAAGHRLQADRRHVPPEQLGDLGVLLDLGRGGDDAVHPALDQRPHDVGPVRAARRQVRRPARSARSCARPARRPPRPARWPRRWRRWRPARWWRWPAATRLRAIVFGRYPSSAAAARIRSSVSDRHAHVAAVETLLAVWKLTPARAATSLIDT